MSNTDPQELIERAQKLLKQQSELFGPFNVNRSWKTHSSPSDSTTKSSANKVRDKVELDKETPVKSKDEEKASELSTQDLISNCETLEELKVLCEQADELHTDLENTNLVFGIGNPSADLMVIGEAPGKNEDIQGEPFVGAAGQLLDKIMKAIDLDRSDIYITNILKHRPPDNRNPKSEERERSLPYLLRQIELINPKLILCVGRVSATTLLGNDESLKNMRQKFYDFNGRELMVTYHPAALLRNSQWKRPTWEDVQLLNKRFQEVTRSA